MDSKQLKDFMKWAGPGSFPEPFKGRLNYNNSKCSKYTVGITAQNRVSYTNVNFILSYYQNENGTIKDTNLGSTINELVCERPKDDKTEVCIYNEAKGEMVSFSVAKDTNKITMADVSMKTRMFALWEAFYQDTEFFDHYQMFKDSMDIKDLNSAWDAISVLNDNMYRRLKDDGIMAVENAGLNSAMVEENVAKGLYTPTGVLLGQFEYLKARDNTGTSFGIPLSDFIGKYPIDANRVYTEEEKKIMANNKLEEYYIVGNDDIEICNDIVKTSHLKKPFRTFTLVGPPGTGKSHKAKAIANAVVVPNVVFTCNPSTEIFDLIGQVMPPSMDDMEKDAWDLASKLEELGGINFANIAKIMELPTTEDILVCPDEVYFDITGNRKNEMGKAPSVSDAVNAWTSFMMTKFNEAMRKMKVAMKSGSGFKYTETDFIKAIENGWLVEIQEPNVIINEGVLVGLNSILNEGVITLQNGRTVHRHKDSLVFFTTNHDLNGLRDMNQSFLDRSSEIFFVEKPSIQVVADRVISISGNTDRKMVMEMCKLGDVISNAMEKEGVDDGVCGMRSLINWAIKATYTNPYEAAIKTLINKVSLDSKNRNKFMRKLDESWFYQFK